MSLSYRHTLQQLISIYFRQIAVLHGPPGTGKTLTAEAVAEHLKRPLYLVGASELGTESSDLEENLTRLLSVRLPNLPNDAISLTQTTVQLATAWDAVLLIDEADVGFCSHSETFTTEQILL